MGQIKKITSILVFLVIAFALPATAREKVKLITFEYPPMWTKSLPKDGLFGEIIHAIYEVSGSTVELTYLPAIRLTSYAVGSPKVIGTTLPLVVLERIGKVKEVVCSAPLVNILMVFYYFGPKTNQVVSYSKIGELKNYRVGALRGSNTTAMLRKVGIHVEESALDAQIKKLQVGRIDLAIVGLLTGKSVIEKHFSNQIQDFKIVDKPLLQLPSSVCFNKKHPKFKQSIKTFSQGLKKIVANGQYKALLEKYYGKGNIPKEYNPLFAGLKKNLIYKFKTKRN